MSSADFLVSIVDDDLSVREGVTKLVRSAGLRVESFASAQEFLDKAQGEVPSCLVLDVHLRGLSGLDLQQQLAREEVRDPDHIPQRPRRHCNVSPSDQSGRTVLPYQARAR